MIPTTDFNIVGSFNKQRLLNIDAERAINCFEYRDPEGKKPKSQLYTSGLKNTQYVFSEQTEGVRAQYTLLDFQYIVVGNGIYRQTFNGTVSLLGYLENTSSGYVGITANDNQILFVDGVNGYIWDTVHSFFIKITDTHFPGHPIDAFTLDNFIGVIDGGTPNFQISMFLQAVVWGPDVSTFTADSTGLNNWLILSTTDNYQTGVPFTVSTTGTLPSPLNNTDTYYAIWVDATHIRVASSQENAYSNTPILLTSDGTPTNTITSLGVLQQGAIESYPGTIVACKTLHRRIYFFSEYFTEVWENAGIGFILPFRRNNSLLMEYGCAAIGSAVSDFDLIFFLSKARNGLGAVMMVRGTEALPVSTRALDYELAQYYANQQISDCRAFLIKENGLIFYRMNFTAANHTYVFNVSQSQAMIFNFTQADPGSDQGKFWHEEEVLNGDRHPAQCGGNLNGINYVGDYKKPILYILDVNTYTNNSEAIRRARITRVLCPPGYQRLRVDRFQIDMAQGLQVPDFVANNMHLYLAVSKDGGTSYGYKLKAPMGTIGNRTFRTVYRKLGTIPRGQGWVVKIEFYDPYPFAIFGAAWAVSQLPE